MIKDKEGYERGMKTRRSVLGDDYVNSAEENKSEFDRDFQHHIAHAAWNSIWSRPGLSKRERSMITVAILAVLGHDEELKLHLKASKNTGCSVDDIKEVLLHIGVYAGVPVSNRAFKIAKKIFDEVE